MFASMNPNPTPISRDYNKKIAKIIQALLALQQSNIFRKQIPYKALGWQDYKEVVKKPIDLNYVRRQNNQGKYKFVQQFLDQIQLIWDNVFIYAKKQHESYEMALKMQKHFDEILKDFLPEYYQKINRVQYFKQFEPVKNEKKTSNISDRHAKKVEKMDIENPKEQVKVQKYRQSFISSRRRDAGNLRKQQTQQQTISVPATSKQRLEQTKRKVESEQKIVESRRNLKKSVQREVQQSLKVEMNNSIQPHETVNQNKGIDEIKNTKNENKQSLVSPSVEIQNQIQNLPNVTQPSLLQNQEHLDAQDSQENHFPPIMVNLNKTPTPQEVLQITQMMRLLFELQQMEALSKTVKILTKYEKQNMIIDGEDVNFKMNQIHISTYSRIRKQLQAKIIQIQQSEKIKDLNKIKDKFNIKLSNGCELKTSQNQIHQNGKIAQENQ